MSKKGFLIILVLSLVVTIGSLFVQFTMNIGGPHYGFPLSFSVLSLFGSTSTNYLNFIIDVIFWFMIIWAIWKGLMKLKG